MRKSWIGIIIFSVISCANAKEKDPCKNPEYAKVKKEQVQMDVHRNDLYAALNNLLEAKRCNPKDPEVYYWLSKIYLFRQEIGKSKENIELAIQYNPKYSDANLLRGDIYLVENNLEEALKSYQKASSDDLFREAYIAWNDIGWIFLLQDKLPEAENALNRSMALNSGFCNPHTNLGELRSKQKKYPEAVKELQQAIQLCPYLPRAHRLLGLEYNRQGKTKEACSEFNQALRNATPESDEAKSSSQYLKLLNCSSQK